MSAPKIITLLLIGMVGGVLIAPAKGSKTRKKLRRLFNDVSDSIQDIIEVFRDTDVEMENADNTVAAR